MTTLTEQPIRRMVRTESTVSSGDKSYTRLVSSPASRYFWLTAMAWVTLSNALVLLILFVLDAPTPLMWQLCTVVTLASFGISCAMSADRFLTLHYEYLDTPDRTITTTNEQRAVVTDQARGVDVNGVKDAIVIRRQSKRLEGVTFQGQWLEKMADSVRDGNRRFTRAASGISGSAYPECREALKRAGYIDHGQDYTDAGLTWLTTK